MEVALSNRELINMFEAAKRAADGKMGLKLAYAIAKNLKRIEGDCQVFTGQIQKRRQALIDELAIKDETGRPLVVDNQYQFTAENRLAFDSRLAVLQNEVDELLATEVNVDLHRVKLDQFPDQIEPWIVKGLFPMIDEDGESKACP